MDNLTELKDADKLLVNNEIINFKKDTITESLKLNDNGIIEHFKNNNLIESVPFSKTFVQKQCDTLLKEGYTIYTTTGEDGVYTSNIYNTVETEDQAVDTVAELQAQGINASYVKEGEKDTDNYKYVLFNPHNEKYLKAYPDEFCNNMGDAIIFDNFQEASDYIENKTYNDEDAPKDITDWEIVEYEDIIQESVDQNLDNNISNEELDTQISNTEQAIEKVDQLQDLKNTLITKLDDLVTESVEEDKSVWNKQLSYNELLNMNLENNLTNKEVEYIKSIFGSVDTLKQDLLDILSLFKFKNEQLLSIAEYIEELKEQGGIL